jgi:hypothetical protein
MEVRSDPPNRLSIVETATAEVLSFARARFRVQQENLPSLQRTKDTRRKMKEIPRNFHRYANGKGDVPQIWVGVVVFESKFHTQSKIWIEQSA